MITRLGHQDKLVLLFSYQGSQTRRCRRLSKWEEKVVDGRKSEKTFKAQYLTSIIVEPSQAFKGR